MSDVAIADLEALLRALAQERSLRSRLRVLGHSWQLLRSLSPMDRERVALRLGSKWAWKRVEKTFLQDGELSENEQLVGRAFERMGGADPTELRRLARTIREGDSESARDLLMLTLTEALEEQAEEEEARPAPSASKHAAKPDADGAEPLVDAESLVSEGGVQDAPVPEARLIDRVDDVLTSSRARPVEAPEPRPAPTPTPVAPRAFPAPQEATPAPREAKPAPASPQPTHAPPEPKAAPAPRQRESTAVPPPALERPPPQARGPTPAISGRDQDDSATLEPRAPVAGADRLRVLRALQRSDRPGADLGRAGRAALVESLGGGWASRRALTRMIRTHSLDGLDEALGLVQDLVRPGQQTWCLADLIEHWELDSRELDRVLGAAPTDAVRRRLQRRIANP